VIPDVDTHRIPRLLADDILGTLGEQYLGLLRETVKAAYVLVTEAITHPTIGAAPEFRDDQTAQADFDRKVIDEFQQRIHDERIDTAWPACPRHSNHPLAFDHEHKVWRCPTDSIRTFPLGRLADA
jgi:hypothetical protein